MRRPWHRGSAWQLVSHRSWQMKAHPEPAWCCSIIVQNTLLCSRGPSGPGTRQTSQFYFHSFYHKTSTAPTKEGFSLSLKHNVNINFQPLLIPHPTNGMLSLLYPLHHLLQPVASLHLPKLFLLPAFPPQGLSFLRTTGSPDTWHLN